MDCNLMDNIMRDLYFRRNAPFVDIATLNGLGTDNASNVNVAIDELVAENYVQKVDGGERITELGESFCKSSSFCCNSKPIVM